MLLFIFRFYSFFACVCVSIHIYVYCVKSEEGVEFSGTSVAGSCQPADVGDGYQTHFLYKSAKHNSLLSYLFSSLNEDF